MAVKAIGSATITDETDIDSLVTWYRLSDSDTSTVRTNYKTALDAITSSSTTPSGWSTAEPAFQEGSTKYLHTVIQTRWKDGTCTWGDVQLSSAYEASKQAYNRALATQTSLDNLEIGGRNLLLKTGEPASYSTTYLSIYEASSVVRTMSSTDVATVSFEAKSSQAQYIRIYFRSAETGGSAYNNSSNFFKTFQIASADTWTRYTYTAAIGSNVSSFAWIACMSASAASGTSSSVQGTVEIRNMKLEKGNKATDWTPAPEDVAADISAAVDGIEIGGRNYVSVLAENWVQKTVSESSAAGTAWTSMQGTSTTRISTKELVPVSGASIAVSAASGYDVFITFFDVNDYMHSYLGWSNSRIVDLSSYSGCTHVGLTVRKSDNTSAITPSEAVNAKVKLELGNVATDWTPAPEDMATSNEVGILEPPYTEVEWVESNGKQYVYLDWKPSSATWGFEADFIVRNAFSTTESTWDASANANGYGTIFGVRNASKVNDFHLSTYKTTGTLCYGNNKEYKTSGILKTDGTRQTVSFLGTTITRGDGTTVTVSRGTDAANKPYSNMAVFARYNGNRKKVSGDLADPGSVRVYSLKFYENTTLKVDLVGAVRKKDGVTGLYDRVAGKFHPAPSMTYGDAVGDLGVAPTVAEALNRATPHVTVDNATNTRMWRATCNELVKLEDGQEINVTPMYTVTKSYQTTELVDWDDTGEDTYVYMKLTLADGSTTEWIPCYYMSTTRLTTHYGAGNTIRMTYREDLLVGATATAAGSSVMRGFYCDPNYDTNTTYNLGRNQHSSAITAYSAITKNHIICGTDVGYVHLAASTSFSLSYPLLYATAAIDAAATATTAYETYEGITFTTTGTVESGDPKKTLYVKGTVSGNTFTTVAAPFLTTVEPTTEDGKVYIPIGLMTSATAGYFQTSKDLYAFLDGEFRQVTPTEVVAEQDIYCQSDSILNVPTAPDSSTWVTANGESVSDDEGRRENLIVGTSNAGGVSPTAYAAYDLLLSTALEADETYTIDLYGVDIENSGSTTSTIEVGVYYCGGSVRFGGWKGTSYFTDGHADHLRMTFTPHTSTAADTTGGNDTANGSISHSTVTNATTKFIALYNLPSGTVTRNLTIARWQVSKGGWINDPVWTTKPPTHRSTHPVTFVARQRMRLDGTIVCTTPAVDDTATVLNGDNIVVGKIDAQRVDVVNLNAANISTGYISSDRIEGGSLSIEKFSEDVQTKFETYDEGIRAIAAHDAAFTALNFRADSFTTTQQWVEENGAATKTMLGHMSYSQGKLTLDASDGEGYATKAVLSTEKLGFESEGAEVAYFSNQKLYVTNAQVLDTMQMGGFAWIPRSNGNLSLKWVGGVSHMNLLRKTETIASSDLVPTRSTVPTAGIIRLTPTTSAAYAKFKVDYLDYAQYGEGTYTVSFDARLADVSSDYTSSDVVLYVGYNVSSRLANIFSSSYDRYGMWTLSSSLTSSWQRVSKTFVVPTDLTSGKTAALAAGNYLTVQLSAGGSKKPIEVRNVKLEIGSEATPWSANPND